MNYYRDKRDGTVEVLTTFTRACFFKSEIDGIWKWIAYDGWTQHTMLESEVPGEVLMTALLLE